MKKYTQLKPFILILSLFFSTSILSAQVSDEDKILILTDYLITKEAQESVSARNQAIATIYGKPIFKNLIYDDASEMFFAQVVSQKGDFVKDVNFYMPRKRALSFKKDLDAGKIEIEHAFNDNEIVVKAIELNYNNVNYPLNVKESTTVTLKLGGYFVFNQDTEFLAKRNGIGTIINLQDSLQMQTKTEVFKLDANYKFNDRHKIEFSYYAINNFNSTTNTREIEYNGETIAVGSKVDVHFDTDIYKLNYIYSAYQTNKLDFSFRVGLHATSVSTGLVANFDVDSELESIKKESVSVTAPLPVFGLGLSYEIVPSIRINYTIDYFFISYEDISGRMTDTLLALEYQHNKYLGLGVGLNSTNMFFKAQVDKTEFQLRNDVAGILAYLTFSY